MPVTECHAPVATRGRLHVVFWGLLCCGLLLAGIAEVSASFIPFHLLRDRVRALSNSGQGTLFTYQFYRAMQLRLRLIAVGNLALALALLWFRRQMCQFLKQVFADLLVLVRDFKLAARTVPVVEQVSLAGIALFAALLRIPLLSQPMRYDEAATFLEYSSHPFYVALSFYNAPNNHLLHTLLVRLAYLVFGNYPWALRLPAMLAGLCLVPASYIAARSLYRTPGALLAAGLIASSSILVEYSTNARGYSLLCLLFVSLIPLAAYAVRNQNWAAWSLFAIFAALGFYTIPIMLYPFGGICLWLVLSAANADARPPFRSTLLGLSLAVVLTVVITIELYTPVFAVSGPAAVFANKWVVASPVRVFFHQLPLSFASTWREWNRDLPLSLTWILTAGFLVSLLWHRRYSRSPIPLALGLFGWVVPLVLVQRVIPFERVWLFALPLYFITATAALAALLSPLLERLRLHHGVALVAIAVSLFLALQIQRNHSVYSTNEGRGFDALAVYLKQHLGPRDSVVAALPSDVPLLYYFRKEGVQTGYLNAPKPKRLLVVVNAISGDTVQKVLAMSNIAHPPDQPAKLLIRVDSASLYELILPQSN